MRNSILIVSSCADPLSELEFVMPLKSLLKRNGYDVRVVHYREVTDDIVSRADRIIISGTNLKDFGYINEIDRFEWIQSTDTPLLGICAGYQVLGLVKGEELEETLLIGKHLVTLASEWEEEARVLLSRESFEAYFLNSRFIKNPMHFDVWATSTGVPAVIKHRMHPFVGCLFHPEVLNPEIILNFMKWVEK